MHNGQLSVDLKDSHQQEALGSAVCSQHQTVSHLGAGA